MNFNQKLRSLIFRVKVLILLEEISNFLISKVNSSLLVFLFMIWLESHYWFCSNIRAGIFFTLFGLLVIFMGYLSLKLITFLSTFRDQFRTQLVAVEKKIGTKYLAYYYDLLQLHQIRDDEYTKGALNYYQRVFESDLKTSFKIKFSSKFSLLILSISISMIIYSFCESSFYEASIRCYNYQLIYNKPSSHQLFAKAFPSVIKKGDTTSISCSYKGKKPAKIFFHYKKNKYWNRRQLSLRQDSLLLLETGLMNDYQFFFSTNETASDTINIKFLKEPQIRKIKTFIDYPAYTKMISKESDQLQIGRFLPVFSCVKWVVTSSADSIKMIYETKNKREVYNFKRNKNQNFIFEKKIINSGNYSFILYKNYLKYDQLLSYTTPKFMINIVKDEYPSVELQSPSNNYQLSEDQIIPLSILATDDYGIKKMKIFYKKKSTDTLYAKYQKLLSKPLSFTKDALDNYTHRSMYSLGFLRTFPGDEIEVFVRVYDNDPYKGPKYSDSRKITLKLPTLEQLFDQSNTSSQKEQLLAKKLLKQGDNIKNDVKKMISDLKSMNNINHDQQLQKLLEKQSTLNESTDKLQKTILKTINKLQKNNLVSKETLDKYQKLNKMLKNIFDKDFRKKLSLLAENKEKNLSRKDWQKLLENFSQKQKDFEKSMEKTLNMLQKLQKEEKLDHLVKRFSELEKAETDLLENIPTMSKKELFKIQRNIKSAFKEGKKELASSIVDFQSQDSISKKLKNIEKNLENLAISHSFKKFLDSNTSYDLSKNAKDIENTFEKTANDLAQIKENYLKKEKEKIQKEVTKIQQKIMILLKKIRSIMKDIEHKNSKSSLLSFHIKFFENIVKGHLKINKEILELASQTFFIDRNVFILLNKQERALYSMRSTLAEFNTSGAYTKSWYLKQNFINIIIALEKINSQIKKSKSASGLEEMRQKLEKLAQKQQHLNQQTEEMMQDFQQDTWESLSRQQAALNQALQKMLGDMGQNGMQGNKGKPQIGKKGQTPGLQGPLSNSGLGRKLSDMGNSMNKIEEKLKNRHLDRSVLKDQRQLLKHMLEVANSLKKERFSSKRKSEILNLNAEFPDSLKFQSDHNLRHKLLKSLDDGYLEDYKLQIKEFFKNLEK